MANEILRDDFKRSKYPGVVLFSQAAHDMAFVEYALAPSLPSGQVVVMDNLAAHKGGRVREIVEGRGREDLYLPPYSSPDLNPIEQAFSKVKGLLREAAACGREALIGAMGRALDAVTARDASGYFGHCGYRPVGQLP